MRDAPAQESTNLRGRGRLGGELGFHAPELPADPTAPGRDVPAEEARLDAKLVPSRAVERGIDGLELTGVLLDGHYVYHNIRKVIEGKSQPGGLRRRAATRRARGRPPSLDDPAVATLLLERRQLAYTDRVTLDRSEGSVRISRAEIVRSLLELARELDLSARDFASDEALRAALRSRLVRKI